MAPWRRKHDAKGEPVTPQPAERLRPFTGEWARIADFVRLAEATNREIRACGSHWALSRAAVSGGLQVETHDPEPTDHVGAFSCLNQTLYDVIPKCMSEEALSFIRRQRLRRFDPADYPDESKIYLYHVEAGTRIYELYHRLDKGDDNANESLARQKGFENYMGPWAMATLGGAGGQTIAGAFSTGTHGGDIHRPPIADAVQAIHLIGAGGVHYWIEKPLGLNVDLVDDEKVRSAYPGIKVIRDIDVLNAVTVAAGRMGVIYSVVLRVVRQYALFEDRFASNWSSVKPWLSNPRDVIFGTPTGPAIRRFAQVIINPNAKVDDRSQHSAYVTTRDYVPLDKSRPSPADPFLGRAERSELPDGTSVAGDCYPLSAGSSGSFNNALCESDSPIHFALRYLIDKVKSERDDALDRALVGAAVDPSLLFSSLTLAALLALLIDKLKEIEALIPRGGLLYDTLASVVNNAAERNEFEVVRRLVGVAYDSDQSPRQITAVSYALMDIHNYRDTGCTSWGDSLEVFFNASSPGGIQSLIAFVDNMLGRVISMESQRLGFAGYIALRFMAESESLIAMQRWDRTCSVEVAGMGEVRGTEPFLKETEKDAIALGATVHWGQRNNLSMSDVERMYSPSAPDGRLFRWRSVLSLLSDNGRLAAFSTDFTRQRGLEVVQPRIAKFDVSPTFTCAGETVQILWDALSNPPGTAARLQVSTTGSPAAPVVVSLDGLKGIRAGLEVPAGDSSFTLIASKELNGRTLDVAASRALHGVRDHEVLVRDPAVTCLTVDGLQRWGAEVIFDESVSEALLVEEVHARFGPRRLQFPPTYTHWNGRRAGIADLTFNKMMTRQDTPSRPQLKGLWVFFVEDAGCRGTPPVFHLELKLVCRTP